MELICAKGMVIRVSRTRVVPREVEDRAVGRMKDSRGAINMFSYWCKRMVKDQWKG